MLTEKSIGDIIKERRIWIFMDSKYYDGTKLLSMLDINGDKPEIYICTTNRSGGKTTYFGRLCVNRFFDKGEKFCLVYRFSYELDDCADKFYKDIGSLFFPNTVMTSKKRASGVYHELYIDGKSCGYAISINNADQIKKNSHLFSDVVRMLFDEFQSETNHYCSNEVAKLISVHTSIARGQNKQVRYVPLYMVSNPVSIINPYYTEMGISNRLRSETKFLRGEGFVLEQGFVESASKAQKESAFNRAFANNNYLPYSTESVYLNDNNAFIEKPKGRSKYVATLKYEGKMYALREYLDLGIVYCDDNADASFPFRISATTNDHQVNYVMLKRNEPFMYNMRYLFEKGCFRFKDLKCKEVIINTLSM